MGFTTKDLVYVCAVLLYSVCVGIARIRLTVTSTNPNQASIRLDGLDTTQVEYCEFSFSEDYKRWTVIKDYKPENNTVYLGKLYPHTHYGFFIMCDDNSGIKYKSEVLNFTTGGDPSATSSQPATTMMLPTTTSAVSDAPLAISTTVSPSQAPSKHHTPTRDIWLGVALGLISIGGFICGGYYVVREYRRRMRIRRFFQYRQQENETFPDIDQDEDEGIVM